MNEVRVLPEIVANKIAAGEVVERPASVVKELIENAIDAGATMITVQVYDDGQYISVTDNGRGMSREDARLSIHRHTTSKIYDPQDLYNIKTLGFRGEALASIASVSQMSLITRKKKDMAGVRLDLRGGELTNMRSAPHPPGTTVQVQHLFFNTPARYKFLKSPRVEMQHVKRAIILQALVHPDISFCYKGKGPVILDLSATGNPLERIRDVFGNKTWKELLSIEWLEKNFSITGFVSRPEYSRKDKKHQFLFVNSRPVVDNTLFYAVRLAYQDLIESHRHPFAVIYVHIHPELIDVNVHPNKYEIRFKEERCIFNALREAVQNRLLELQGPAKIHIPSRTEDSSFSSLPVNGKPTEKTPLFPGPYSSSVKKGDSHFMSSLSSRKDDDSFVIAGQLFFTYVLVLKEEEVLIIDQHALHEKILYYKLKTQQNASSFRSQLLVPEVFEIESGMKKVFENKLVPRLKEIGYDVEFFGGNSYIIKSYPTVLKDVDHKTLVQDYLDDMMSGKTGESTGTVERYQEKLLILSSCKKAVKKGAKLKEYELYELIREYFKAPDKYQTCPHGRPVAMKLDRQEIDKYFHRDY